MARCNYCDDTGWRDSGGVQPWGEPITVRCECIEVAVSALRRSSEAPAHCHVTRWEAINAIGVPQDILDQTKPCGRIEWMSGGLIITLKD